MIFVGHQNSFGGFPNSFAMLRRSFGGLFYDEAKSKKLKWLQDKK